MTKFKTSEVKLVGKVKVSAKRLMELAEQLKKLRGTDGNEEIEVYLVPGKDANEAGQLAFDFVQKQAEQKPEIKEEKSQVKVEEPKPEKPAETKPEETPQSQVKDEKNQNPKPAEPNAVDKIVNDEKLARQAEEITKKAYQQNTEK